MFEDNADLKTELNLRLIKDLPEHGPRLVSERMLVRTCKIYTQVFKRAGKEVVEELTFIEQFTGDDYDISWRTMSLQVTVPPKARRKMFKLIYLE